MLLLENRLKRKKDFEKIFKQGESFKQDFLFLKIKKNNLNISRFAFIVSQKVSKKAVIRNKIKRWLREAVRTNLVRIISGVDCILTASPGIEIKNFKEAEETVSKIFNKIKGF